MFKSIVLHERRSELTRTEFMKHWIDVHTPMSRDAQDLYGYVCHEVIDELRPLEIRSMAVDAKVDGIAQMWFKHPDGLLTLPSQPSVKKWFSDGPNFIGRRMRFVGAEHVFNKPQRLGDRTPKLVVFINRGDDPDPHAFQQNLDLAVRALSKNSKARLGVCLSHIVSSHPTPSIAGFPMPEIDSVLEIWMSAQNDAVDTAAIVAEGLKNSGTAIRSAAILAFATMEIVIRAPTESGDVGTKNTP